MRFALKKKRHIFFSPESVESWKELTSYSDKRYMCRFSTWKTATNTNFRSYSSGCEWIRIRINPGIAANGIRRSGDVRFRLKILDPSHGFQTTKNILKSKRSGYFSVETDRTGPPFEGKLYRTLLYDRDPGYTWASLHRETVLPRDGRTEKTNKKKEEKIRQRNATGQY